MKINIKKQKSTKALIKEAAARKLAEAIEAFDKSEYGSEEYYKHLVQIEKLKNAMESNHQKVDLSKYLNANVVAAVITTLGGILGTILILTYENDSVITSKATAISNKMLGR